MQKRMAPAETAFREERPDARRRTGRAETRQRGPFHAFNPRGREAASPPIPLRVPKAPSRRGFRSSLRGGAVLRLTLVAACLILLGRATQAHAAGDRALGEYLAAECATCHQSSGRQVGAIPAIIGYPAEQFVALMEAYKDRQRENPVMRTIAGRLGADEIAALAAYYESLKPGR